MFRLAVLKFARCFDSYVANLFFCFGFKKNFRNLLGWFLFRSHSVTETVGLNEKKIYPNKIIDSMNSIVKKNSIYNLF